jgi:hypothetical protein
MKGLESLVSLASLVGFAFGKFLHLDKAESLLISVNR